MQYILFIFILTIIINSSSYPYFFMKENNDYILNMEKGYIAINEKTARIKICIGKKCIVKIFGENLDVREADNVRLSIFEKGKKHINYLHNKVVMEGSKFDVYIESKKYTFEEIFVIKPGMEVSSLVVKIEGADYMYLSEEGNLVIILGKEKILFSKPFAYQYYGKKKIYYEATYVLNGNTYSFNVEGYDKSRKLYIDPILKFSTFGGAGSESVLSMSVGRGGDVYVVGFTTSQKWYYRNVKVKGFKGFGSWDVYVARFDSNLERLKSVAIIRGSKEEWGKDIVIDENGYVYICGWTHSEDLPVTDDSVKHKDADIFIAKLDPTLNNLIYLGYIGGNGYEYAYAMEYYGGYIYVTGETSSPDFPVTKKAYDKTYNGGVIDIFVMKFDRDLNIVASTLLGGKEGDAGLTISVDDNAVYIGGLTWSRDLPVTEGIYDKDYNGGYDGYIAVFSKDLSYLKGLTYLGGSHNESITSIELYEDYIIVGGKTFSQDFPVTKNVIKPALLKEGDSDGFISILSKDLKRIVASTYIGGYEGDEVCKILATPDFLIVGGTTSSDDIALKGEYFKGKVGGKADGFLTVVDYNLRNIYFSTYLGDQEYNVLSDMLYREGKLYLGGWTLYLEDFDRKGKGVMEAFLAYTNISFSNFTFQNVMGFLFIVLIWTPFIILILYHYRR